jgi:hypothetical protein
MAETGRENKDHLQRIRRKLMKTDKKKWVNKGRLKKITSEVKSSSQ